MRRTRALAPPSAFPAAALVLLLLLLLLLGHAPAARAQSVVLKSAAREIVVDLRRLPPASLALPDPTDGGAPKKLLGTQVRAVLELLPRFGGADTLAVRCDDGWLSLVPLEAVYDKPGSILAFQIEEAGGARALPPPRGPIFLAFPVAHNESKNGTNGDLFERQAIAENGYAFGVASLEYVKRKDLLSPLGPTLDVIGGGAALYARHCLHCHAFRGVGGLAAWDLSSPPLMTYRDEKRVRAYVQSPRKLNPQGRMPSFRGLLSLADMDALLNFLKQR